MRLFLAFGVDDSTRKLLTAPLRDFKREIKGCSWVPPENLHITVKFLGEVEEKRVGAISDSVERVCRTITPFDLEPKCPGAFPNPQCPRVLWMGYTPPAELPFRVKALDGTLTSLGFAPEKRPFKSHVTLARIRKPLPAPIVAFVIDRIAALEFSALPISTLNLMESRLSPEGAHYTIKKRFPLGGKYD